MDFRNSFCYRIENNSNFKYEILSDVGPLGTNLTFFLSLGIAEISGFPKLSIYSEIVHSKPFCSTLNYASIANFQKKRKHTHTHTISWRNRSHVSGLNYFAHQRLNLQSVDFEILNRFQEIVLHGYDN